MKYKAVVCDMDGTLTPSRREASHEMRKAIAKLSKDYHFVVVTGGKLGLIKEQITDWFDGGDGVLHLMPTSGNQYWRYYLGEYLKEYEYKMNDDDTGLIVNALATLIREYEVEYETMDQIELRGSQVTFSALGRTASHKSKDMFDPDTLIRKEYVSALKEYMGKEAKRFAIRIGGSTSIDFTYKGHDKGFALKNILQLFKITKEEVLFFGDKCKPGGNDYEIAKEVDFVEVKDEKDCLQLFDDIISGESIANRINFEQYRGSILSSRNKERSRV